MTVGTPWAIILRLGVSLALFGQEREHLLGDCECWETRFFEQKLQDLAVLPPVATRHGSGRQLHAHQLEDLVLVDGQDRLVVEKRMVVSAHVVRDFGVDMNSDDSIIGSCEDFDVGPAVRSYSKCLARTRLSLFTSRDDVTVRTSRKARL